MGEERRIPKIESISRDAEDSRRLVLHFYFVPTDDQMREIHELLKRENAKAAC